MGRVGQKYKEGDKKQENPQDKEGDSTHDFNLKEGQQVRVQRETKFQRVVEVRGNSARLSESGNNFVHVTKLTDSKGEPIIKERKADKGEIKELEDAVKSLKGKDKEDLGFVLSSYKEGDLKSATAEANNLDTAMREMIPVGILKELGFKLTPKGEETLKNKKLSSSKIKDATDHIIEEKGKITIDTLDPDTEEKKFKEGDKIKFGDKTGVVGKGIEDGIHDVILDK